MEKIQILGEIVDNRSFVKMPKGKRNRNNKNRNKNKEKQQNSSGGGNLKNNTSLFVKTTSSGNNQFNYAENVPTEIWMKIFSFCDQVSLDNLKMTCVTFYNIIDSNAAQYGIFSKFQKKVFI